MFLPLRQEVSTKQGSQDCSLWSAVELEMTEPVFWATWRWGGPLGSTEGTVLLILESDVLVWADPARRPTLEVLQLAVPTSYRGPWAFRTIVRLWKEHCEMLDTTVLVLEDDGGRIFTRWLDCPVPKIRSFPIWSSAEAPGR